MILLANVLINKYWSMFGMHIKIVDLIKAMMNKINIPRII